MKPSDEDEYLVGPCLKYDPPPPYCSGLALLAMPLAAVVSIPFWTGQVGSSGGQFSGPAFAILTTGTAAVGAGAGLILAYASKKRGERYAVLRILAWLLNGAVIAFFTIGILQLLL